MIDKTRAVQIAEGWGSYMNSADPGICMYGLSTTGKIQSPAHRVELIDYIKNTCIKLVDERIAATAEEDSDDREMHRVDREELGELLEYCEGAPVESVE